MGHRRRAAGDDLRRGQVGDFDKCYDRLPEDLLSEIDDRLDGTSIPRPEISDQLLQPMLPITTEDEEEDNEDLDDDAAAPRMGGDCFTATVAFRDRQHPAVWMLRWFRDNVLWHSAAGRALVGLCWHHGPVLAQRLAAHPNLGMVIRSPLYLIAQAIALVLARRMGKQADHRYWPENRACALPLAKPLLRPDSLDTRLLLH